MKKKSYNYDKYMITLNKKTEHGILKAYIIADGIEGHLKYVDREISYSTYSAIVKYRDKDKRKQIIDDAIEMIAKRLDFDFIDKQTFTYIVYLYNTVDLVNLLSNTHVLRFLKKYCFEIQWLMF